MEKYIEKLRPNVSDTWKADELWVKVNGDMTTVKWKGRKRKSETEEKS